VSVNGRLVCNLPDHPIHAGATAVVAVITGDILTVANAGDSRAVLCRRKASSEGEESKGFYAYPMSYDHKPSQTNEMNRILRSGGFVNHFGRINGNLNLSRSIGDLKYKQVPGIPPAHQMITAEPDIMQVVLQDDDEFLLLGCDGIWDCLSNHQAVDFVMNKIDTESTTEIGKEMLDQIISDDPRITQGIGGDNMTIMIVDFKPASRSRNTIPPEPEATQEPAQADAEAPAADADMA
jgi:serine/threonine protein phosphatase PrpC